MALNSKSDTALYLSPRNSSESGFSISRGTDLLVHRAPSGIIYFYLFDWSIKKGESNICQIISKDSAIEFIVERSIQTKNAGIADSERNRILEYFPGIFNEGT
ncbi:MAG: hypothetical protein ABSB80_09700 [Methanoregula sp.]|uniref:hypothetical protein n=1 Tax=Methanoregula sp. TaxID=2052170 RepID=UPI003D130D83